MTDYKKMYEEALERARDLHDNHPYGEPGNWWTCEKIFPELKESEDEKIRKAIHIYLDWLDGRNKDYQPKGDYSIKDMIAWLEKQSEKLPVGFYYVNSNGEKFYSDTFKCGDVTVHVEKQDEQKPIDKVEPKFGIESGKWYICISQYFNCIEGRCYQALSDGRIIDDFGTEYDMHSDADKYFRLWTIQDAKDGDVLSWDDSKCIALFKNIYDEESFNSYGFIGHCTGKFESRQSYHDIESAHPATKEQRDLLFSKMKEAGYEWDAENKELKKIEQNLD